MRLHKREDAAYIWGYAKFNVWLSLTAASMFVFSLLSVVFRNVLPRSLNPLTAPLEVVYVEIGVIGVLLLFWTQFHFRNFRNDVSLAHRYKSRKDMILWLAESAVSVLFIVGFGMLFAKFGLKVSN